MNIPKLTFDENAFGIVANKPLRETVFEILRKAIIDGTLKPSQHLMEVQIAEQLGVSRTPVREAIRKLENEGFVTMVPKKGAYVTPFSTDDLSEMMEIRSALEALAAKLAANNASPEQIEELKHSNELFEKAIEINQLDSIINTDVIFHEALYSASGNSKLKTLVHLLQDQMTRLRVVYVNCIEDKTDLVEHHKRIIKAIEEKKPELASEEALKHISLTKEVMVEILEKFEKN